MVAFDKRARRKATAPPKHGRLCIGGALAVCLVIVALVGEFVALDLAVAVAVLFVVAMVLIVCGLVFLLREVNLATSQMREGMEIAIDEAVGGAGAGR